MVEVGAEVADRAVVGRVSGMRCQMWVPSGLSPKIVGSISPRSGTAPSVWLATVSVMSVLLRDRDRVLGAVRGGEAGLLTQVVGDLAVVQQTRAWP